MKVQDALQNINTVVSNTAMKLNEHQALQQSIQLIAQRCERADELEKRFKRELKHGNKIPVKRNKQGKGGS